MWMLAFSVLPLLALVYVCWHVWMLLPFGKVWKMLVMLLPLIALGAMVASLTRTIDKMPLDIASVVYEVGNSLIFVLLYLVMIFVLLDIGRWIGIVRAEWLHHNGIVASIITIFMIAVFGYGNLHYHHKYRQAIDIKTPKALKQDRKIVLLSDLHLGYHNRRKELHRWVDMINAEHADAVLIAGDLIDLSVKPLVEERDWEELRRIDAPVYACLGNHEYISGVRDALAFYHQAGITLLKDSVASVAGLTIIGRDDRSNTHRKSLRAIMKESCDTTLLSQPIILLDHQPYHLEEAENEVVDFQFSGHTHHGQVWPISWITDALYEDAFGATSKGKTQYYVSSGMGIWGGKFRIGTRSEYIVLTIKNTN